MAEPSAFTISRSLRPLESDAEGKGSYEGIDVDLNWATLRLGAISLRALLEGRNFIHHAQNTIDDDQAHRMAKTKSPGRSWEALQQQAQQRELPYSIWFVSSASSWRSKAPLHKPRYSLVAIAARHVPAGCRCRLRPSV